MKTSQAGIDLIKKWEGMSLTVYKDAVGLPTVGYGHLLKPGEVFGTLTSAGAETLLRGDLQATEKVINQSVLYALEQHQFDAVVSLVFNIGAGAFKKSTLLKKLNETKNRHKAATEFGRWILAGDKVLDGLIKRRAEEALMFNS
jgi:lysozyme